jgi:DNA-binding IclR family transcriptional regulator
VSASREPVARALDVLAWIADHRPDPLAVRQIARDLDTTPTTVHRILRTFEQRGLVARGTSGEYVVGLELYRICASVAEDLSLTRIAHPHLQALAEQCNETTIFGMYDSARGQMIFADRVESLHPVRYIAGMHNWIPLHAGATGLAILAFLPETERRRIYEAGLAAQTPETIVSVDALEAELELIRRQGYAHSAGQRTPGAAAFGAPVFDSAGNVCGDLCVTLPVHRLEGVSRDTIVRLLLAASKRATEDARTAGYRAPALSESTG